MKTETNRIKKNAKIKSVSAMANTGSLYLNIKVVKGNDVVHEQRGKSFVANFARLLALMMQAAPPDYDFELSTTSGAEQPDRVRRDTCVKGLTFNSSNVLSRGTEPPFYEIVAWEVNGQADLIDVQHIGNPLSKNLVQESQFFRIYTGPHAGVWERTETIAHGSTNLSKIRLSGLNASSSDSNALLRVHGLFNSMNGVTNAGSAAGRIELGKDDSPTEVDDAFIKEPFHDSEITPASDTSITPPVTAAQTTRISIASTFTNNTGAIQTIRELGLNLIHYGDGAAGFGVSPTGIFTTYAGIQVLCARDVLDTPIEASIGETFSIIYEILCNVDASTDTVINENFADMLYRQLARTSRACRDYFNNTHNTSNQQYQFRVYEDATNRYGTFISQTVTSNDRRVFNLGLHGIVLGYENEPVDIDDVYLRDSLGNNVTIPNGKHTGALIHYPTYYTDFEIDSEKAVAVFSRFVENQSGAPITIKQIGFNVASASAIARPTMIARTNLAEVDWFTINDGEFYRIDYKIGIALST